MSELEKIISDILKENPYKIILSNPLDSKYLYKSETFDFIDDKYLVEKKTVDKVFHENLNTNRCKKYIVNKLEKNFKQLNAWDNDFEYSIKISKKSKILFTKNNAKSQAKKKESHNKIKNYIFEEGEIIEPLIDMGILTKEGQVISQMYDKFKQINRFIELIDDLVKDLDDKELNVLDFACGKSYLTFLLYYYFENKTNIKVNILGLDLKEELVRNANKLAKKYGYERLNFRYGDISNYEKDRDVDMVISLHACDTATDYALFNAINWGARFIFSVPCCQHEINSQITKTALSPLTDYGIVKEKFSSLLTDSIRANLLKYSNYSVQILEFVSIENTDKNFLIRAKKARINKSDREKALKEVEEISDNLKINQKLHELIKLNIKDIKE